jgi:hypothetical protein
MHVRMTTGGDVSARFEKRSPASFIQPRARGMVVDAARRSGWSGRLWLLGIEGRGAEHEPDHHNEPEQHIERGCIRGRRGDNVE